MNFLVRLIPGVAAVLLCAGLNGCLPPGQSQFEEEKESHYLAGKSCASSMDYPGAIEAFEKAVEVNPRSAAAHLQLGMLYEEKEPDAAAAIFHYEKYLKLRPDPDKVEWIKQRINNCKQDLAKTVLPLPIPPGMQREFEHLAEENKRLRDQNNEWSEKLRALAASRPQPVPTNPPPQTTIRGSQTPQSQTSGSPARPTPTGGNHALGASRTHVVQPGETLTSIARKHGVKLDTLINANPGIDPRKVRVGKVLNVPPG